MVIDVDALNMGSVSRLDGRFLLRFERVVHVPFDFVWRSLTASPEREMWIRCGDPSEIGDGSSAQPPFRPALIDGPDHAAPPWTGITRTWRAPTVFEWSTESVVARWELSPVATSTRLSLTTCLDSDDIDVAATAGADHHACFARLVRLLENGPVTRGFGPVDVADLARRYANAAAVALADTD